MTMWTVVAPAFRAPDEPMHVSTILRLADTGRYPPAGQAMMVPSVLASYGWVNYFGMHNRQPTVVRPGFLAHPPPVEQLSGPNVKRAGPAVDQMTQHPPGYYLVLAGAVRVLQLERLPPGELVVALRLLSAMLLLPIPLLCTVVARRVALPPRAAGAAAFLPAAWMQFVHLSAAVNNGSLLALATGVATAALLPVTQGDVRLRRGAGVGAAVSVALLSKGFALSLLPVVLVAYLCGARRSGARRAAVGLLFAGLCTIPGLWWWGLNLIRYGSLQPQGGAEPSPVATTPPLAQWVHDFGAIWMRTMWIALGWAEGSPPAWSFVGPTIVFVLLLLTGSWALRRRPAALLVLHLTWLGPFTIVALGSLQEFMISGETRGAQGRYVQTAVVGLAVIITAGLRPTRWLAAVPLGVLAVATACLGYGVYHFWTPVPADGAVLGRVSAMTSWLAPSDVLLVAGAALAGVSGLAGALALRAVPAAASRAPR